MLKIIKNRYVIAAVAVILALILSFGVLPRIYKNENSTIDIVKTTKNLEPGSQIREEDLTIVTVGRAGLPSGTIMDKNKIIGKYASVYISRNDLLFDNKFSDNLQAAEKGIALNENELLVSLSLPSAASGVADNLQSGSIVDVACYIPERIVMETDPTNPGATVSIRNPMEVRMPEELKGIKVYGINNSKLESLDDEEKTDAIPYVVTLIVTADQAKTLIEYEYTGKIHLIKRG